MRQTGRFASRSRTWTMTCTTTSAAPCAPSRADTSWRIVRRKPPARARPRRSPDAMADWLLSVLQKHPEVTFFLVLGIGYVLGKIKLGGFTLGAVTGTLLAGVAIGQLGVEVSGEVKQCFF